MAFNLGTATGSIQVNTSSLNGALSAMRGIGLGLTGIGTSLVGVFGAAVGASANFEARISEIKAVTGETDENISLLRDAALDLGKKGPFGPKEVAGAFVELAKAGLTATEIIEGAGTATINLAKAGDLKIADAAEIAANVMRTFGIEADKVNHVVDILAGAANQSTLDVQDLATSLKYVGGVSATLGVTVEDTATALALLGNAGIKGSTGGTSLRQILLQLNPVSKQSQKALKGLGIITEDGKNKFFDAAGNAKSLADVFDILRNATQGLGNDQKVQAYKQIFGNRAAAAALILTEQGSAGFGKMSEAINKVSAADVAAERLNNLSGSIRKFKAALEAALIDQGGPFQKTLKSIVDWATKMLTSFHLIPGPVKTVALALAGITGVLSLMAGGFLLTIGPIFKSIKLLKDMAPVFKIMRLAMAAATKGVWQFTASLLANPITWIVIAVVALAAALFLLYKKNKTFRKFVDNLWQILQKVWDKILGFFRSLPGYFVTAYHAVRDALGAAIEWIKNAWGSIVDFFKAVGSAIVDAFIWLKDKIVDIATTVWDKVTGFFKAVGGAIADAFTAVVNWFKELPGKIWDALTDAGNAVGDFVSRVPYLIGYMIGAVIGSTAKFFVDVAKGFWDVATTVWNAIFWAFTNIPKMIGDALVAAVKWVWNFTQDVVRAFNEWTVKVAKAIWDWAGNVYEAITDFVVKIGTALFNFFTEMPPKVWGWLVKVYGAFQQWISNMILAAIRFGVDVIEAIVGFFQKLPGRVAAFLDQAWEQIKIWVYNLTQSAGRIGTEVIDKVVGFFQELPGNLKRLLSDAGNWLYDIGKKILQGLIDGAKAALGKVKEFFQGITKGIKDWKGPMSTDKTLLKPAGMAIMDGLITAVESRRAAVRTVFQSITSDIAGFGTSLDSAMLSGASSITGTVNANRASVIGAGGAGIDKSGTMVNIYNPQPAAAEESLALTMRKLQYLGVVG